MARWLRSKAGEERIRGVGCALLSKWRRMDAIDCRVRHIGSLAVPIYRIGAAMSAQEECGDVLGGHVASGRGCCCWLQRVKLLQLYPRRPLTHATSPTEVREGPLLSSRLTRHLATPARPSHAHHMLLRAMASSQLHRSPWHAPWRALSVGASIQKGLITKSTRRDLTIQQLLVPRPWLICDADSPLERGRPVAEWRVVPRLALGRLGLLRAHRCVRHVRVSKAGA